MQLPNEKFEIIYCDPPWDYAGQKQHNTKKDSGGALSHYPTMTLDELIELPIDSISSENSLLFMWTSSPHLDQAIELGVCWGFKYKTIGFVWDKIRINPGFYTMSQCEIVLIFKKGKIPTPRGARNIRQYLQENRTHHSAKPDEIRQRIHQMFPTQNKIELFARRVDDPNWTTWGNES